MRRELETIKVNQSLFAPLGGTIVEVNASLESSPELINQDPYGRGWIRPGGVRDSPPMRRVVTTPRINMISHAPTTCTRLSATRP